ncbi:cytochrome C assembly family protein [Sulfobacillus thermosulfidooxidans]|uniref:cytochrome C assembly family protein n=1 Tax=Sulfobacillus thermosulfidooxidans TaxID=28034 RepID=UPI00042311C3|nr:cytochrome c biogenesis protein CcsA [Sulfobacillus thermosulfidooxidans]
MGAVFIALVFLGYLSSSVFYVATLYNDTWRKWGFAGTLIGLAAQTSWFIQEAIGLGTWPDETLYDWIATLTWVSVIVFALFQLFRPTLPLGGFLMPVITLMWLGSQALSRHIIVPPHLDSTLLAIHVTTAIFAYVAFLLAAVFSIMYTEKERELKRKKVRLFYYQLPSLEVMDVISGRLIFAGLIFFTVTLIAGTLWAKQVFHFYWSWSAKEVWSIITWLVYLGYAVLRMTGSRGHKAAVYAMSAFLFVFVNLFVVGVFFHGFHFYDV